MDSVFFFLSLAGLIYGIINLSALLLLRVNGEEPGTGSLLLPLVPLNVVTALEIAKYYLLYRFPERQFLPVDLLFEWARLFIAAGWLVVAYHHYALNRIDRFRKDRLTVFGTLVLVLFILLPFGIFSQKLNPILFPWIHGGIIFLFFFAGIKGFTALIQKKLLLESSRTAAFMAGVSLLVYPAVAAGDFLGWRIPFLDPEMTLWVQAHPLYVIVVNLPLTIFLINRFSGILRRRSVRPVPITPENTPTLTDREREVLILLFQGYRYAEIAERLYLSLATVKTHIYHIYQKLDISHRGELNNLFHY
jgi:DNA-binding CsgD family transcriptional regulator